MIRFTLTYHVKFRAFFITFGEIRGVKTAAIKVLANQIPLPFPERKIFDFNDRGLSIAVKAEHIP